MATSNATREHYKLATTGHLKKGGSVKSRPAKNDNDADDMCSGGKVMKKGGSVKHSDVKEDRKLVDKMVKKEALTGKKRGGKVGHR
jgi:hypothetical protein